MMNRNDFKMFFDFLSNIFKIINIFFWNKDCLYARTISCHKLFRKATNRHNIAT